jgi:mannosyltransferase OCH1-like enzyme
MATMSFNSGRQEPFQNYSWATVSVTTLNMKRPSMGWDTDNIPRLIHQMAPLDKKKWHVSWAPCHDTWKQHFSGFEHKMWTDEALDSFVMSRHPTFYDTYQNFKFPIQRFDVVRYFILYEYGGIYADMDIECLGNFYEYFQSGRVNLAMSEHANERYQNALMAAPPKHPFWHYVISEVIGWCKSQNVLASTGPIMLSRVANIVPPNFIHSLNNTLIKVDTTHQARNMKTFKPSEKKHTNVMAIHHGTGTWIDYN